MAHDALHPAMLWKTREDGRVDCQLCQHRCTLAEDGWGICGVRTVRDGRLQTAVYGKAVAVNDDPIEKKPLFHFYPGSTSLSIATFGCNFRCAFCQNWSISQVRRKLSGQKAVRPEEVVAAAEARGCRSISFTYTEPTIFFEYAYDTAVLARARGLDTVFVTNGFMTPEALDTIGPYLAAANVDLKCFRDETYRRVMGGRLAPVLDNLRAMRRRGVWVEVTTLVVPGMNDSDEELGELAAFIAGELGPDVPWHVSRFHPDYEMTDRAATSSATLQRAQELGSAAGLRHVYVGNAPGLRGETTFCHGCGHALIERHGFRVLANRVRGGACPECGAKVAGVGLSDG